MPISWNEIRARALAFSREWADETREHAEAKTFWDEFFKVFGLTRRHVASFEEPVRNIRGHYNRIDVFWKAILLGEHKSAGESLDKAHTQAVGYIQDLTRDGRADEVPQYIIVSDFAHIALHDLVDDTSLVFALAEFHQHVSHFGFIAGYRRHKIEPEDPINITAVRIMGDLHDALERGGYSGHELERLLVRILFCLFADDTGIFDRDAFKLFLENHTNEDGSDLGPQLARVFQVLNTPPDRRQRNLLEELAALPYVNGELYAESLTFAEFNSDMRNRLLACTKFDWSRISPAVFGALFQAVMEPAERRQIGAHYTSERDILKVIGPLFLDDLKNELRRAGNDARKLRTLHNRLADMRLLDPACGCGNFLVVSYRELRLVELEIVRRLSRGELAERRENEPTQRRLDVINTMFKLDVHQFYGIEIEEWPVRIAEVAMWLMDHQMNQRVSEEFGEYFVRLPLRQSPHIHHGNALRIDWNDILPAETCTHVFGNPPFVGKKEQSRKQKSDFDLVWKKTKGAGVLDYVTCWYKVAAEYFAGRPFAAAFVSTNSISQGEQVAVLWKELLKFNVEILFAHRSFKWISEARGKAHVTVVVIGFGCGVSMPRKLYDYESSDSEPTLLTGDRINPYLVHGPDILIESRRVPICKVPAMVYGSFALDDGFYTLTPSAAAEIIAECPEARRFIKPFIGGKELLHGIERYCLWLKDAQPAEIRACRSIANRVDAVRKWRASRSRATTVELSKTPSVFAEIRQPKSKYLAIPTLSSERRLYIPIGLLRPSVIASNQIYVLPNAGTYEFGVLSSMFHMAWIRHIAGRLELRYRYSNAIVYNNFPWPQNVTDAKRETVEECAQLVLDARDNHPDSSLADLYDPLSMPADLVKAHAKLDRAVDRCYRSQPFSNERNRVEYLFNLYQELTAPLLSSPTNRRRK